MLKEITSKEHPLVKHFVHLRQNRDYRHEFRRVVIEGEKLVRDIICHHPYHHLLILDRSFVPAQFDTSHVSLVTEEVMKKISGFNPPPNIMAEVDLPHPHSLAGLNWILALDRLQDPGNLGTLYRTAYALGWEGVFLIGDTVDPYNDKALRASQGATIMLPTRCGTLKEFAEFVESEKLPVFVGDSAGSSPKKVEKGCLVLGREGEGLDRDLLSTFPSIGIPLRKEVESLNVGVAGGLLLYLMKEGC